MENTNRISPNPIIPSEFYNSKSFFSLSGSAAAVWLFCLVVHSVFYKSIDKPDYYKIIALILSEIIAIAMIFESKKRAFKFWVISIFNGILIFIYATGFNTISANLFSKEEISATSPSKTASLSSFLRPDINWWPNKNTESYIDSLQRRINHIENENTTLRTAYIDSNRAVIIYQLKSKVDSLSRLLSTKISAPAIPDRKEKAVDQKALDDCRDKNAALNSRYIIAIDSLEAAYKQKQDEFNSNIEKYKRELNNLRIDLRNARHGQNGVL